ncbi:MAG TPA: sulfite exporter TauE/SafE family protein [Dongiaceae bacterium]|nr:sulfite exporter TauE/SafE family protein [Dongiaceae bacterium]
MQIYLPIAQLSLNLLTLLAIGGVAGILAGLFGVGGGFILTPFLIFAGVPPAIAVASQANQVVAASFSSLLVHWARKRVDFILGIVLTLGGLAGSSLGLLFFDILRRFGQIDALIPLAYVLFLCTIGITMGIESVRSSTGTVRTRRRPRWQKRLPWAMKFRRSRICISPLLPLGLGFTVGVLSAILGVSGAFLMVPAMIYILRVPTMLAVGTSLLQVACVSGNVTFLHATHTHALDAMLALILTSSGVIGAQIGTRLSARFNAVQLRLALAALTLALAGLLLWQLTVRPAEVFSIIET